MSEMDDLSVLEGVLNDSLQLLKGEPSNRSACERLISSLALIKRNLTYTLTIECTLLHEDYRRLLELTDRISRLTADSRTYDESFIHDAVVISQDLNQKWRILELNQIEYPSEIDDWLKNFILTGKKLSETSEINAICEAVKSLIHNPEKPSMYAALIGPRLSGKTQVAFALAHKMNVLYFACDQQKYAYKNFKTAYKILNTCVEEDEDVLSASGNEISLDVGLYSLGFLMSLLGKDIPGTISEWFVNYIKIDDLSIFKLSIQQFKLMIQRMNIDLKSYLVVIDSMKDEQMDTFKAFKMICCAVHIPIIISHEGLDHVYNLIEGITESPTPWVKIITRFPPATLDSIGHVIKFKQWNNPATEFTLSSFYDRQRGKLDLEELFQVLFNVNAALEHEVEYLKVIFEFFESQCVTNLPGLIITFFNCLIKIFKDQELELKAVAHDVWNLTMIEFRRKMFDSVGSSFVKSLGFKEATYHDLTSGNTTEYSEKLRTFHQKGKNAHHKIQNHLYRIRVEEVVFDLSACRNTKEVKLLTNDGQEWTPECHLSGVSSNFLNTWTLPYEHGYLKKNLNKDYAMTEIHKKYIREYEVATSEKLPKEFKNNLLTFWATKICSRVYSAGSCNFLPCEVNNVTFGNSGNIFIVQFMNHLIKFPSTVQCQQLEFTHYEWSLDRYFQDFWIPFLVDPGEISEAMRDELWPFVTYGKTLMLNDYNCVIFDFNFRDKPHIGMIESRLIDERLSDFCSIYPFYKRAVDLKCPFTILIVDSIAKKPEKWPITGKEIKQRAKNVEPESWDCYDNNSMSDFAEKLNEIPAFEDKEEDGACKYSVADFKALWEQVDCMKLNIYTVEMRNFQNDYRLCLWTVMSKMKVFNDDEGCFLIIQRRLANQTDKGSLPSLFQSPYFIF